MGPPSSGGAPTPRLPWRTRWGYGALRDDRLRARRTGHPSPLRGVAAGATARRPILAAMDTHARWSRCLLAGGLGALLLVTACSGGGHSPAIPGASSSSTAAPRPTPSG